MNSAPPDEPDSPAIADEPSLLRSFVRERDVECPRCRYNLRNLSHPVCPECSEPLVLHVGLADPKFGIFLATVAPGMFGAIMAVILFVIMVTHPGAPSEVLFRELFLVCSGVVGIGITIGQRRFRRQSRAAQVIVAIFIWSVHVIAFLMFMHSIS